MTALDPEALRSRIRQDAVEHGFSGCGFARLDLGDAPQRLREWLDAGLHGEMDYLARHADLRSDPSLLVPGALSVISVRMPYLPPNAAPERSQADAWSTLQTPDEAYVARYALGRDYHKLVRNRLEQLAQRIETWAGPLGRRVFCDSAPVLEVEFGERAGLGWRGKHTLLLNRDEGSWFFLGEIVTTLDLPADPPTGSHCGTCTRCLDVCPTQAIVAPYRLDARRCISYLTIEHAGPIPEDLRPLLGNRIYGCDDCQLVCPWNRYAQSSQEPDFAPRHSLDSATLIDLFAWDEPTFLRNTEGSAIRRIGHARWLRNLAVALGNAPTSAPTVQALQGRAEHPEPLVREHVQWALEQHCQTGDTAVT